MTTEVLRVGKNDTQCERQDYVAATKDDKIQSEKEVVGNLPSVPRMDFETAGWRFLEWKGDFDETHRPVYTFPDGSLVIDVGRVSVKFYDALSHQDVVDFFSEQGFTSPSELPFGKNLYEAVVPANQSGVTVCGRLFNDRRIEFIEPELLELISDRSEA